LGTRKENEVELEIEICVEETSETKESLNIIRNKIEKNNPIRYMYWGHAVA
jgi:hypothetical protein